MSAKLSMRVFESALDSALKPTAALLALFGTDDGDKIFPSIARLSFLLGVSRRTVERRLAELREIGVLTALGRGRTILYRLHAEALPSRDPFTRQARLFGEGESEDEANDTRVAWSENRHATFGTEITPLVSRHTSPVSQTCVTADAGSVRDQSVEQLERTARERASDPPPNYGREAFAKLRCQLVTAKLTAEGRRRAGGE